jgi:hypothetical protein
MTRERFKAFSNSTGIDKELNKFVEDEVQSIKGFFIDEKAFRSNKYFLIYTPKMKINGH